MVHHIFSHGKSWGIYLDEGSRNITVQRNLVYKTNDRSFLVKDGPNTIYENIFAYPCNDVLDNYKDQYGGARFKFCRNIVLTNTPAGKTKELLHRWHVEQAVFENNVYWDISNNETFSFNGRTFESWQEKGYDTNSVIADPLFSVRVPEKLEDFTLSEKSPARKLGFGSDQDNPINFSDAGLYGDKEWISLPKNFNPRYNDYIYKRLDSFFINPEQS